MISRKTQKFGRITYYILVNSLVRIQRMRGGQRVVFNLEFLKYLKTIKKTLFERFSKIV